MTSRQTDGLAAARAAALCAGAMIAHQVGSKATRDAIFLSSFDVTALPTMVIASALASVAFVLVTSRLMGALGPARLIPLSFAASGALQLAQWWLAARAPRIAAVAVYLHVGAFGSVLISGFWLLLSERFDPRTAKRRIGRIAGAGTLGGLLGGLLAERLAARGGVAAALPCLALLHFLCAGVARLVGTRGTNRRGGEATRPGASVPGEPEESPVRLVVQDRYLRSVASLVVVGSVAAALADYLFKAQAAAVYRDGPDLMRFFAAFYAASSLLTFVLQAFVSRASLEGLGLVGTVAALPGAIVAFGVGNLVAPGLASACGLRGAEGVLRGSLHRLGYELLYTPVPPRRKRATKALVDVGLDRMGDIVGGALVRFALAAGAEAAAAALGVGVVLLGLLGLRAASSLHRGYVQALEKGLLSRAVELGVADILDRTTRETVLLTLGALPAGEGPRAVLPIPVLGAADPMETGAFLLTASPRPAPVAQGAPPVTQAPQARPPETSDPMARRLLDLRSGDSARVRRVLEEEQPLDALLVPQVVRLLAWDEVSREAAEALRRIAQRITGLLVDCLLDPEEEFAVRRRIPRVLSAAPSQRATEGLLRGLEDGRFEVRYECGRALARMTERDPGLRVVEDRVVAAVLREAATDKSVWESRRLLDEGGEGSLSDALLRARVSRSLEHVFTLLSLALPRQPLRVAFRGLHTDDQVLRGTALEYLESVLPPAVRESLWPFLEDDRPGVLPPRSREEVLEELMRSHHSIEIRLAALGKKEEGGEG